MDFRNWDTLLYGIERGECILFLGPELPLVTAEGARRVPVEELAARLLAALDGGGGNLEPGNLPQIAQRLVAREDEVRLEMEVARWHEALEGEISALHDDLAALPFRWIVTSSHDPLIEAALVRAGKTPAVERYHYRGKSKELLPEPSVAAPVLFHLYGRVEEPASVVITDTQLLDFLASLIARDPPLPNDLNATLTNGRLFVFLGFGLRQWYLRILLHVLKVLRQGSRAFAFETIWRDAADDSRDAVLFYRESFKVDIYPTDVVAFAHELRRRYAEVAKPQTATTMGETQVVAPAVPRAPMVFVCHASEDAEHAREIHDALKRVGLEPWLDKENLRGGDRWDSLIERTIQKVAYFVVLNSHALIAKSLGDSYVNKEIKLALRADDRRFGTFIIPATLDDAPLLDPLADFQAEDLRAADGIQKLIRAIKRQASLK